MKTVLVDDGERGISVPGFFERIGSVVIALKNALPDLLPPRNATPWHAGYDAFYESGMTNPHAAGSDAHQAWSEGHDAARDAFEW